MPSRRSKSCFLAARWRIRYEGTSPLPRLCISSRPLSVPPDSLTGKFSLLNTSVILLLGPTFLSMPSTTLSIAGLRPVFFTPKSASLGISLLFGNTFCFSIVFSSFVKKVSLNSTVG